MLTRMSPKLAMEMREQLMKRFHISWLLASDVILCFRNDGSGSAGRYRRAKPREQHRLPAVGAGCRDRPLASDRRPRSSGGDRVGRIATRDWLQNAGHARWW